MNWRRQWARVVASGLVALAIAGCPSGEKPFPHAVLSPSPKAVDGATATLKGADSKPFKLADLKGQWVWLYFGFTHCPDVCPAAMDYMAAEYKHLARPQEVTPVFVSVDPKRDDAKALKAYTAYYGPEFVGATGDKATLDALTREVGAGYVIDPPSKPGGDYNVSHTNLIFVLDPDGRLVAGYVPLSEPGQMAKDFDALKRP